MDGPDTAIAERVITRQASRRLAQRAVALLGTPGARSPRRLTIVHKANILPLTDGLFRDTVREVLASACQAGLDVEVDELLVDIAALKLVAEPQRFDVIITTNLFGDILSDEAAYWCGGMGLAPSLNWGEHVALAEPVHGSAPDIAGMGIANPIAAILSAALLARYAWVQTEVADRIDKAVSVALTHDLPFESGVLVKSISTAMITDAIIARL
jgi:homoisocitrate dehydrogenase